VAHARVVQYDVEPVFRDGRVERVAERVRVPDVEFVCDRSTPAHAVERFAAEGATVVAADVDYEGAVATVEGVDGGPTEAGATAGDERRLAIESHTSGCAGWYINTRGDHSRWRS
jgi:hypothetical protein